ncbi:MAG: SET domain-containing protein-lysine N-methyltransferase [Candidatus Staskawiczbacteria bacterium]|nr:SET domain-containing protein-lysine N-methyltransferase [Candidatus Staskawiczbacteria bacterium]
MNAKKQKVLESLKNTYCRLKPSGLQGVGVFAVRNIKKGTNPFLNCPVQEWENINPKEFTTLDNEVQEMINDFFAQNKDGSFCIPEKGLNGMDISFFLNGSSEPNIKTIGNGTKKEIRFEAKRDVEKGEELTVAYSDYDERYKNQHKISLEFQRAKLLDKI